MSAGTERPASASHKPSGDKDGNAKLSNAELAVSDTVGKLIEFWGFKRNMGRIWSVLYLAPMPLTASDLKDRLQISTGAVSMALTDLSRWGVVKKVWVQGERRDYYTAELVFWRMISRVFAEREGIEIRKAIESFEGAVQHLEGLAARSHGAARAQADFQARRIRALLDLARLGRTLLEALLATAKLDAEPLARFLLGDALAADTPPASSSAE